MPCDQELKALITKTEPAALGISPPCTTFSALQRLSQNKGGRKLKLERHREGLRLLNVALELAEMQMDRSLGHRLCGWGQGLALPELGSMGWVALMPWIGGGGQAGERLFLMCQRLGGCHWGNCI